MSRPLVAVTGGDTWLPIAWWFIAWGVRRAGGQPFRLTPQRPRPPREPDAVVISGGDDIDPGLYLPEVPDVAPMDPARDRFETQMIESSLARSTPLLGICRGAQLINVVRGGRLHTDLRRIRIHTSNRRSPFPVKTLRLEPQSQLADIMALDQARINSLHHQAVSDLGEGLKVAGRDQDDIVQAIEDPAHPFLFGVQWHPEYLPQLAAQRRLFRALVQAAHR